MSVARGRAAEELAAVYVEKSGFSILDRNWHNRWCELDIVSRRAGEVHFVEVKYRRNTAYGFATDYISRDKIGRLRRAAVAWCQAHEYAGPYHIDVVSVEGDLGTPVIALLEDAIID